MPTITPLSSISLRRNKHERILTGQEFSVLNRFELLFAEGHPFNFKLEVCGIELTYSIAASVPSPIS